MKNTTLKIVAGIAFTFSANAMMAQGFDFELINSDFLRTQTTNGTISKGDVDGDGDIDVFIASGRPVKGGILYLNDGKGNFTKKENSPFIFTDSGCSNFADVDGDGDLDLLLTGRDFKPEHYANLYLNDGKGNFTLFDSTSLPKITDGDFAFGDIDKDGDLDLITTGYEIHNDTIHSTEFNMDVIKNTSIKATRLFQNNGKGKFTELTTSTFEQVGGGSVAFLDFDKDNDLDLIIAGTNANNAIITKLYSNNGSGVFTEHSSNFIGVHIGDIEVGDSDGDGDMDILLNGYASISGINGNISVQITKLYTNDGKGIFTEEPNVNFQGVITGSVKFADFDNDGDNDVYVNGSSKTLLYENLGSNKFELKKELKGTLYSRTVIDDFNGDNNLDIIIMGDPATYVYFNQSKITAVNEEVYELESTIFPNPTSDYINISLKNNISTIELFNLTGVRVQQINVEGLNEVKINVGTYPEGIYLVKTVNKNNEVQLSKFVKK